MAKTTVKADPKRSAGAREERAAFRQYLRRVLLGATALEQDVLDRALTWVLGRQARYDQAPGGLGRHRPAQRPTGDD